MNKSINQHEKQSKRVDFAYSEKSTIQKWMDPKYSFYDYLQRCELKSFSKNLLKECIESCNWDPLSKHSYNEK